MIESLGLKVQDLRLRGGIILTPPGFVGINVGD